MRLLSFDIGLKNLAYCFGDFEPEGINILKWDVCSLHDKKGKNIRTYNLPVGAHIMVDDGEKVENGKILVKIPRKSAKSGDITGGLPRVTELFEARNPSNPAVVSEIDGVISFGKIKRGNREIIVESKTGEIKKYLVKLSNQILVQENDFVKAGMPLSDGSITPTIFPTSLLEPIFSILASYFNQLSLYLFQNL